MLSVQDIVAVHLMRRNNVVKRIQRHWRSYQKNKLSL